MNRAKSVLPILCIVAILLVVTSISFAGEKDDYISFCLQKQSGQELKAELLSGQSSQDPILARDQIWKSTDAREGASSALKLMAILLPEGDPGKLDELKGFIGNDESLPKQVLVIESSLAAISSLVDMRQPDALWLAHDIFKGLNRTSAFKDLAGSVDQGEYQNLSKSILQTRDLFALMSNGKVLWKDPQNKALPLSLAKIGEPGNLENSSVLNKSSSLVTLNKDGQITAQNSYYGWDLSKGVITRVRNIGSSGNGGSGGSGSGSSGSSGGAGGSGGSSG